MTVVRNIGGSILPDVAYDGPHLVVAAFDPGIDTGWSSISYPLVSLVVRGVSRTLPGCEWEHGEITRPLKSKAYAEHSDSYHVDEILEVGREIYEESVDEERGDGFALVMERFDLRMLSMDPNLLAPVRVISIWRDRLRTRSVPRFYQSPSDAKRAVTDERLRSWGLYDRHSGEHARDADRHNVLFARRFMSDVDIREKVGMALPRVSSAVREKLAIDE